MNLQLRRIFLSLLSMGALTFAAHSIFNVNATTAGFAYLLLVLLVASTWGFIQASITSVVATLVFNFFFFPPLGTFSIADAHNWVALLSFLSTSLIASRLSTKAKKRALDAVERQQDIERLYTFSRAILLMESSETFGTQLVRKLADTFQLSAAVLFDRQTREFYRSGSSDLDSVEDRLRETVLQGSVNSSSQSNYWVTPVRLGSETIASLAVQGSKITDSALQGISNLVAIGLQQARSHDLAQQIETARQSEQLRTVIIDAMAHEFKTPLTSIKAATTGLLANPDKLLQSQKELLNIADEEAEHLRELIDDTVAMARLDTQLIEIHPEMSDIMEILTEVIHSLRNELEGRALDISMEKGAPAIAFDRRLVKLAVKQLIDNAAKYSPAGAPLEIQIKRIKDTLTLRITDHGNGIPEEEQPRVFERFYRSPAVKQTIPGSGLGLCIAHSIMRAHNGDLTVTSLPGNTTFCLSLPTEYKGETIERGTNFGN